MILIIFVTLAN